MAQDTQSTLLSVENLSVDYFADNGTVHAVRDVSFTLAHGEILGIAGESGCGKSTLVYAISRLLRPPAEIVGGRILYSSLRSFSERTNGQSAVYDQLIREQNVTNPGGVPAIDILRLTPAQLRSFRWKQLSIVFQSAMNALNPVMTIGKQIIDVLQAHNPGIGHDTCKKRATELLELVGIAADRLNSYPHELSGGMRQRTVIAIALALKPDLIIMDEPTTALDVVVQHEIIELISSLCKELSTAIIFITHDLSLLLELADRIAVMYAGQIVEMAPSAQLAQEPRHPYSYGLLNAFPTLKGPRRKMVGIPGSPPDLRHVPSGCTFCERCPGAFAPCTTIAPVLMPVPYSNTQQPVACHLYNPQYAFTVPGAEQFARGYEALAARKRELV